MSSEHEAAAAILNGLKLGRDGVVIVHSSFRGLSHVGLRADAFCEALLAHVGPGTLLMPAMTWRTVTPQNPRFDEIETPSHTGVLTEVFRTRFATHRSLHPTHSAAGHGPLAGALLSTHHEGTTPCAGNSPYGLMRDYDSHILMLGIGLEACTAFHHAEETMACDLYVRPMAEAEDYVLVDRNKKEFKVRTRRHPRLPRNFPKFEPVLADKGLLKVREAQGTRCLLFSARDLYRELFGALARRRDATLGD